MVIEEGKEYTLRENTAGGEDGGCRFSCRFAADALRFCFDVRDDDIVSPFARDNDDLWQGDAVEVFLSPNGDLSRYVELEVSPFGLRFFGEITDVSESAHTLTKLPPPFSARAERTAEGYRVTIDLPVRVLRGFDRDRMKLNAFRLDKRSDGVQNLYALHPTLCGSFHKPAFFVGLVGREGASGGLSC